jgi:hypothetical protein
MCAIQTLLRIDNEFRRIGLVGAKRIDPDYIEGAILWSYDGRAILSEEHWDLVDQLWTYFIDGVEAVVKSETFERYFPDQGLEIRFRRIRPASVLVTIGDVSVAMPIEQFFTDLLSGARDFFVAIRNVAPQLGAHWEAMLARIDRMESSLKA